MKNIIGVIALLLGISACSSSSEQGQLTVTGSASATADAALTVGHHSQAQSSEATSPAALLMKIYELWVSASELCTDPIRVFEAATPEYVDLVENPVLGEGPLDDGTYPCLIFVISDVLTAEPAEDVGSNCQTGVEFSGDICNEGTVSPLPDGTSTTCTADGDDKVAGYLSTAVNETEGDGGFLPPDSETDPTTGGELLSPLVVSGDTRLTMYVDFSDRIRDNGTNCEMNAADVGFR